MSECPGLCTHVRQKLITVKHADIYSFILTDWPNFTIFLVEQTTYIPPYFLYLGSCWSSSRTRIILSSSFFLVPHFNVVSSTKLSSRAEQMCVATELLKRASVYWLFEGWQVRVNGDSAEVVDEGEVFRNIRGCPGVEETVEDPLISTCGQRSRYFQKHLNASLLPCMCRGADTKTGKITCTHKYK